MEALQNLYSVADRVQLDGPSHRTITLSMMVLRETIERAEKAEGECRRLRAEREASEQTRVPDPAAEKPKGK